MSELISNFHFIRPIALLLIPIAFGIWWFWQRSTDPLLGWRNQIEPELLAAMTVGNSTADRAPARWVLITWLLTSILIAGPTWKLEPSPFVDNATPLMILLKADNDMLQPDPAPSRMERAYLKIADLAEARAGQPLGLIAYAGSAHLVLPPTRDTQIVASMAMEVSPEMMPVAGDRLDLAISEALRVLSEGEQWASLLVVADAVDTPPDLLTAMQKESSIAIQFLSINSPDSSQNNSVNRAAAAVNGTVEQIDIEGNDITAIVRRAAKTRNSRPGEQGGQWKESGYWLIPLLGLLMLMSFRRETTEEQTA